MEGGCRYGRRGNNEEWHGVSDAQIVGWVLRVVCVAVYYRTTRQREVVRVVV